MYKVFLRKKISNRIAQGHDWIYRNEIGDVVGNPSSGDLVHIFSSTGSFLGKGFIHLDANIAVRIYTRELEEAIDEQLFFRKIQSAYQRKKAFVHSDYYLLFNGDLDGISGLQITAVEPLIIIQAYTVGIEIRLDWIKHSLLKMGFDDEDIVIDRSHPLRKYEHLPMDPPIPIKGQMHIGKATYNVSTINAWSLERKAIYEFLVQHSAGKIIWDLCCGMGHMSRVALDHGAAQCILVEQHSAFIPSLQALEKSHHNMIIYQRNVFDFLKKEARTLATPQLIIIDPPVFNASTTHPLQAYKELLLQALRWIDTNGVILFGKSNAKIKTAEFEDMIKDAVQDAKKYHVQYHILTPSYDMLPHPLYEHSQAVTFYVMTNF